MCVGAVVLPVVYGPEVEVGLCLSVRAFYLADQVVVVPRGLLIKVFHVGTQEIGAEHLFVWQVQLPFDFRDLTPPVILHVYLVVAGYGGVLALKLADAFQHSIVFLRAALLGERGSDGQQAVLEALPELAVHGFLLQSLCRRVNLQVVVLSVGMHLL